MKRVMLLSLLGLAFAAVPLASATASVEDMAKKCEKCHGPDGNSEHEKVPNIAGMSSAYLHDAMMAYLDGDRPAQKFTPEGGQESDMKKVVESLSEDDVTAIADYYAGKTFKPHMQAVDTAKAELGAKVFKRDCEKCHSEGGTEAEDDSSLLSGQWKAYLEEQFTLFTDGDRAMPKKMAKKWEKLDDGERAALLNFLASGSAYE